VFVLAEGRNTVGRDEGQDLRLEDGRVSGQHAFLFVRADGVSFIDVSTNGSLVDGKPVHGRQVDVDTGAVLRLGDTVLVLTRLAPVPAGAWGGA
jgi:pSer/pThr/pTyr-binding forkhead associated (FHA) protein